ncbi:MAG: hypothetical protein WBL16_03575 [Zwartia sp.]
MTTGTQWAQAIHMVYLSRYSTQRHGHIRALIALTVGVLTQVGQARAPPVGIVASTGGLPAQGPGVRLTEVTASARGEPGAARRRAHRQAPTGHTQPPVRKWAASQATQERVQTFTMASPPSTPWRQPSGTRYPRVPEQTPASPCCTP